MKNYKFHPIADAFPLIEGEEKTLLHSDIDKNGVHEQGVLLDDMILDGRNRYLACKALGIEMSFRNFDKTIDGESPFDFVVSMNLRRRHMTESQRAMTAAKLANLEVGKPKNPEKNVNTAKAVISQEQAAKSMNVSVDSVQRAKKVQENSPASVVKAVESGQVKVTDAAAVADAPKAVQQKALKAVQSGEARTLKAAVKELEPKHKSGKQVFDARPFERLEKHLGAALRMTDDLNRVQPAPKFHRDTLAGIKSAMRELEDWRKAVRR